MVSCPERIVGKMILAYANELDRTKQALAAWKIYNGDSRARSCSACFGPMTGDSCPSCLVGGYRPCFELYCSANPSDYRCSCSQLTRCSHCMPPCKQCAKPTCRNCHKKCIACQELFCYGCRNTKVCVTCARCDKLECPGCGAHLCQPVKKSKE